MKFLPLLLMIMLLAACIAPLEPGPTGGTIAPPATAQAASMSASSTENGAEPDSAPSNLAANQLAATVLTPPAFIPPDGQTLLLIGQDTASIDAYVAALGEIPGGVTGYTSLEQLEGLTAVAEYGSGPHHLDYLAQTYPQSALAVGLYLVNYLDEINRGEADGQIDKLLEILDGYDQPVYLRFGYEFDGPWNAYDPLAFKQAWLYFHDKLVAKGVDNVALVWQSAAACSPTFRGYPMEAWYPGDEVVDWVGISYFTQISCNYTALQPMTDFARARGKPLMIAESAPQRYAIGEENFSLNGRVYEDRSAEEIWRRWFVPFFNYIDANRDVVRAVAYINADWNAQAMWGPPYANGYWGDSRVEANSLIAERWLAEIRAADWVQMTPTE